MDLDTLRVVCAVLAALALALWTAVSVHRWPRFDVPDQLLCLGVGIVLIVLCLAFSIKAADGPPWLPISLIGASLAGLCAACAYRLTQPERGLAP